ncbi:hypothetical protein GCM10023205_80430 [Yinghuangia aomiensis]|uniref:DUF4129 domain-containing protein n=1 Tax=Yinghuangia aomiensis TaxID=676205 RepID=A0ABP9IEG1_9ACTN
MKIAAATPELMGLPVATIAAIIAGMSFVIATCALAWQVSKHMLDGGRVRVSLNAAAWELGHSFRVNRSGIWELSGELGNTSMEVAQLVVENPGRAAVTVYSPSLAIYGTAKRKYAVTPRTFQLEGYGIDDATTDMVVRIDPYHRVSFILDYWSVIPEELSESKGSGIVVRGAVSVAGKKGARKSSRRRAWKIRRGAWTAYKIQSNPSPRGIMWREIHRMCTTTQQQESAMRLQWVLIRAMREFNERPSREEFSAAFVRLAGEERETELPLLMLAHNMHEALERHPGVIADWRSGI